MGSATGPPAVLMSVTVWELRSQCVSRTLLLLFLREIGQEDERRTERQERRGLCRKRRSSGNEKEKEAMEEGGRRGWQISLLMESKLLVSCSCLDFVSVPVVFRSLVSEQCQISAKAVKYSKPVCSDVFCSGLYTKKQCRGMM